VAYGADLLARVLDSLHDYCDAHHLLGYEECVAAALVKDLRSLVEELAWSEEALGREPRVTRRDAELLDRMPGDVYELLDRKAFDLILGEVRELRG